MKMGGVFRGCSKSDVVIGGGLDKNDLLEPGCGGF